MFMTPNVIRMEKVTVKRMTKIIFAADEVCYVKALAVDSTSVTARINISTEVVYIALVKEQNIMLSLLTQEVELRQYTNLFHKQQMMKDAGH